MKKNVRLIYLGRVKKIADAVSKANEILSDPGFYDLIRDYKKFGEDLSPEVIAGLMEENNLEIIVRTTFFMPLRLAKTRSATSITVSYWNFSHDLPVAVNGLIHETVNAIDYLHFTSQKQNYRKSEEQTAPWVIGAIAEIMVK